MVLLKWNHLPQMTAYQLSVGAFYPPDLLPDHQGPYFQHNKSKLVQLDVCDIENDLVAPWNMYNKLQPGTLVLITMKLIIWIIKADLNGGRDKKV